jgi:hypothetical protein
MTGLNHMNIQSDVRSSRDMFLTHTNYTLVLKQQKITTKT